MLNLTLILNDGFYSGEITSLRDGDGWFTAKVLTDCDLPPEDIYYVNIGSLPVITAKLIGPLNPWYSTTQELTFFEVQRLKAEV